MGKVGVATETIKSGQYKDVGSATKPFTDADRHLLQNLIDDVYQQFIEAVSKGRNIPVDRLQPYADGRILSGRQQKKSVWSMNSALSTMPSITQRILPVSVPIRISSIRNRSKKICLIVTLIP